MKLEEYYIANKLVIFKDKFVNQINIREAFKKIESLIPSFIFNDIDYFAVGNFDFLQDDYCAKYRDGIIFIDSSIRDGNELVECIIHELAHSIEKNHQHWVYKDGTIVNEFLSKRKTLANTLVINGFEAEDINFNDINYSEELDDFLFREVGYKQLEGFIEGLFINPYSATSVREYFAEAFMYFFLKNYNFVKDLAPAVYSRLEELEEGFYEEFED